MGRWGVCGEPRVCGDVRIKTMAMMEEGNGNPNVNNRLIMKISQRSAMQRHFAVVDHFISFPSSQIDTVGRVGWIFYRIYAMGWDGMVVVVYVMYENYMHFAELARLGIVRDDLFGYKSVCILLSFYPSKRHAHASRPSFQIVYMCRVYLMKDGCFSISIYAVVVRNGK